MATNRVYLFSLACLLFVYTPFSSWIWKERERVIKWIRAYLMQTYHIYAQNPARYGWTIVISKFELFYVTWPFLKTIQVVICPLTSIIIKKHVLSGVVIVIHLFMSLAFQSGNPHSILKALQLKQNMCLCKTFPNLHHSHKWFHELFSVFFFIIGYKSCFHLFSRKRLNIMFFGK